VVQDEDMPSEATSAVGRSSDTSELDVGDAEVQLMEQNKMLLQLKDMIREQEQSLVQKDAELQVRCTGVDLSRLCKKWFNLS